MDFLSTTEFHSKLRPEVKVTIRVVTAGRRIDLLRNWRAVNDDPVRESLVIWNSLVKDFEGVTVDGEKPSIEEFYLEGPEDVVNEIRAELNRMIEPLQKTDSNDEAIIIAARQQIAEAEARITARKNSGQPSFGSIPEADTPIAANAKAIEKSESDEIAMAAPI